MAGTPDFTVGESPFGTPDVDVGDEDLMTEAEVAAAIAQHAGLVDPHTGYQKESEKDQASGYMGLDISGNGNSPPKAHDLRGARHSDYARPSAVLAETYSRKFGGVNQAGIASSGNLILAQLDLEAGMVIAKLGWWVGTTALTRGTDVGSSHVWLALFNSARVMLAQTADDTSGAMGANAAYEKVIALTAAGAASTYVVPSSGSYYIGLMVNIGTGGAPAINSMLGLTTTATFVNNDAPHLCLADTASTYTTPPAFPFTATESAFKGVVPYARCRSS